MVDNGFQYVINNHGLDSDDDYPYVGRSLSACNTTKETNRVSTITTFVDVTPQNEDDLATAVASGPVSAVVDAQDRAFQSYSGGVFSNDCQTSYINQAVVVVGYGDGYWIVKNSWGQSWGMQGFIELKRGTGPGLGECGIAAYPQYPVAGASPSPPSPPSPPGPSTGAYSDPNAGPCEPGSEAMQLTGIAGSFCSPSCGPEMTVKCLSLFIVVFLFLFGFLFFGGSLGFGLFIYLLLLLLLLLLFVCVCVLWGLCVGTFVGHNKFLLLQLLMQSISNLIFTNNTFRSKAAG